MTEEGTLQLTAAELQTPEADDENLLPETKTRFSGGGVQRRQELQLWRPCCPFCWLLLLLPKPHLSSFTSSKLLLTLEQKQWIESDHICVTHVELKSFRITESFILVLSSAICLLQLDSGRFLIDVQDWMDAVMMKQQQVLA